jgi:methylmalonyl-CoA epimerase
VKLGRLNHIGVATPSIAASIAFYRDVMGATKIHTPFDLEEQGVKVCFVDTPGADGAMNGTQIELIEPLGENSTLAGFLAKNPLGGQHHLCFEVPDIAEARAEGRVITELRAPENGSFIAPAVLRVDGIAQMPREIFGPVLHVATFPASALHQVVQDINATGYGLTFGLHSRIDDRVQSLVGDVHAGNIYVNRNQIGAVVGSQPFGGEGLSGTGPKAGGPQYLARFTQLPAPLAGAEDSRTDEAIVQSALRDVPPSQALGAETLPGPTGESNRLIRYARPPVLCLGPSAATAQAHRHAGMAACSHPRGGAGAHPTGGDVR